jgi:hypothetical protein
MGSRLGADYHQLQQFVSVGLIRPAVRRAKAQIPDTLRYWAKWELALEMVDELAV